MSRLEAASYFRFHSAISARRRSTSFFALSSSVNSVLRRLSIEVNRPSALRGGRARRGANRRRRTASLRLTRAAGSGRRSIHSPRRRAKAAGAFVVPQRQRRAPSTAGAVAPGGHRFSEDTRNACRERQQAPLPPRPWPPLHGGPEVSTPRRSVRRPLHAQRAPD